MKLYNHDTSRHYTSHRHYTTTLNKYLHHRHIKESYLTSARIVTKKWGRGRGLDIICQDLFGLVLGSPYRGSDEGQMKKWGSEPRCPPAIRARNLDAITILPLLMPKCRPISSTNLQTPWWRWWARALGKWLGWMGWRRSQAGDSPMSPRG